MKNNIEKLILSGKHGNAIFTADTSLKTFCVDKDLSGEIVFFASDDVFFIRQFTRSGKSPVKHAAVGIFEGSVFSHFGAKSGFNVLAAKCNFFLRHKNEVRSEPTNYSSAEQKSQSQVPPIPEQVFEEEIFPDPEIPNGEVPNGEVPNIIDSYYALPPDFSDSDCEFEPEVTEIHPFPNYYPGSVWKKISFPGARGHYLTGRILGANGLVSAVAVPGAYSVSPPDYLKGFKIFLPSDTGEGYWIRIE